MSVTEILVIVFGLFLGYWVVSRLLSDAARNQKQSAAGQESHQQSATNKNEAPLAWHETLNVSPIATVDEIQAAYKTLMHQYHPDKVAALGEELKILAERKSKEINVAYHEAMRMRGERA